MSITSCVYKGKEIIYYDLADSKDKNQEIIQLDKLDGIISRTEKKVLILVNVDRYLPGINYLEYATKTLIRRSSNISKAAYIGMNKISKVMYDKYDKYNNRIVNRKIFPTLKSALEWLVV
jgi:hypothetical protein